MARILAAGLACALAGCSASAPVTSICPRPLPHWHHAETGRFPLGMPAWIDVTFGQGRLVWGGGKPVTEASMKQVLKMSGDAPHPRPPLTYDPSGAVNCAEATRIRDMIDASFACEDNRCWQGSRASLEAAPLAEGEIDAPW